MSRTLRSILSCTLTLTLSSTLVIAEEKAPLDTEASSGALLWKQEFGGEIWSPLTLDRGILYFGCDNGSVFALDVSSQSRRWEFGTENRVRSAVLLSEGMAFFASDDGYLYALDSSAGDEIWRFDLGSKELERRLPAASAPYEYDYLHSSPVEANGTIFIGSMDGSLYALDRDTGGQLWSFATEGKIRSTPTVNGDTVYFGSWDGRLYAVHADTGTLVWRFDTGGIVQSSPAIGAGAVIVGSRSAKLFALNADSGEMEWTYAHKDGSWVESSPVVNDGTVYCGSSDALKLFAFDLASGRELWTFKTNGWCWGTPVISEDTVYIGGISASPYYFQGVTLAPGFYAVDRDSGELSWSMTPDSIEGYVTGGVFASSVQTDQVIYVASLDGVIHALRE